MEKKRPPEEGLRSTSFLEIPGIHELKRKVMQMLEEQGTPIASDALDLLIPEEAGMGVIMSNLSKLKRAAPAAKAGAALDYRKMKPTGPGDSGHVIQYTKTPGKPAPEITDFLVDEKAEAARKAESKARAAAKAKEKERIYVK